MASTRSKTKGIQPKPVSAPTTRAKNAVPIAAAPEKNVAKDKTKKNAATAAATIKAATVAKKAGNKRERDEVSDNEEPVPTPTKPKPRLVKKKKTQAELAEKEHELAARTMDLIYAKANNDGNNDCNQNEENNADSDVGVEDGLCTDCHGGLDDEEKALGDDLDDGGKDNEDSSNCEDGSDCLVQEDSDESVIDVEERDKIEDGEKVSGTKSSDQVPKKANVKGRKGPFSSAKIKMQAVKACNNYFRLEKLHTTAGGDTVKDVVTWLLSGPTPVFTFGDIDMEAKTYNEEKALKLPVIVMVIAKQWYSKKGDGNHSLFAKNYQEFNIPLLKMQLLSIKKDIKKRKFSDTLFYSRYIYYQDLFSNLKEQMLVY
ncbi:hypothetical protein EWM64_g8025 [Hericium alpestre]|uniref:DUF6532 domain-containing protein n=1 Tax=Hericium alpestre TaxID=135208 RepID=A0A4Y9ZPK5_9AGAM|nr:hypothetical protein EWM64_g8025 [Hericium alpestre]